MVFVSRKTLFYNQLSAPATVEKATSATQNLLFVQMYIIISQIVTVIWQENTF